MVDGEPTNEGVPEGKEDNKPVENTDKPTENDKENISKLDKLKAINDELEKELIRGRELHAETQKLEAEKMVGGKSDAGQEIKPETQEDKDQELADLLLKEEE